MENINFEGEQFQTMRKALPAPKQSWTTRTIIRLSGGMIRDDRTAAIVILIISIALFASSIFFFSRNQAEVPPAGIIHEGTRR